MSVINQMLKDLKAREQKAQTINSTTTKKKHTLKKYLLRFSVVLLIYSLSFLSFYLFDFYESFTKNKPNENSPDKPITIKVTNKETGDIVHNTSQSLPKKQTLAIDENPIKNTEKLIEKTNQKQKVKQTQTQTQTGQPNVLKKLPLDKPKKLTVAVPTQQLSVKPVVISPKELAIKSYQEALRQRDSGLVTAAIKHLQKALTIYPGYAIAQVELASLHFGRREYSQAITVLEQGLTQHFEPQNAYLLAKIYHELENWEQTLQILTLYTVDINQYPQWYALQASTLQKMEQYQTALTVYLQLADHFPNQSRWLLGAATAYDQLQQFQQAVTLYHKILQLKDISINSRRFIETRLEQIQG